MCGVRTVSVCRGDSECVGGTGVRVGDGVTVRHGMRTFSKVMDRILILNSNAPLSLCLSYNHSISLTITLSHPLHPIYTHSLSQTRKPTYTLPHTL